MNAQLLQKALREHPLHDDQPWYLLVDLDHIRDRYRRLEGAFPAGWLHAVAVKAHPLRASLCAIVESGGGLEAASFAELSLAREVGCDVQRLVFDGPAKTRPELRMALDAGVTINCDNLDEVERVAALHEESSSASRIGVRVNPEVGAGKHASLSVGVRNSKFGVSLVAQEEELRQAFRRHEWLDGLHVHIGSQGYALPLLVDGIRRVVDLAVEVGAKWVDIGGGMPVASSADDIVPTMEEYAERLQRAVPELFDDSLDVITEFGRWIFAESAVAVSRVEYVKPAADRTIATIHFGGDLLVRHVYQPSRWYHPISFYEPDGEPRLEPRGALTVGGPLCFGGDVVANEADLVIPREGDVAVVGHVGAYTFSMWSMFCGRDFPRILGTEGGEVREIAPPRSVLPILGGAT